MFNPHGSLIGQITPTTPGLLPTGASSLFPTPHFPLPTSPSPLPTPYSPLPTPPCSLGRPSHPRARHLLSLLLLFSSLFLSAQITGTVHDPDGYPLPGATVRWTAGGGTTVDAEGRFNLAVEAGRDSFVISYLGFDDQTFAADQPGPLAVVLTETAASLDAVEVTDRDGGRAASLLSDHNIETVSSKELRKAPCCSLAESFENSPVVDLTYGDPLTGRREIQMLGLRGAYTQLTLEKRPMLDGLASSYALDLIPGPWVSGIQIGKGSGSLESGAQGLTGEINTELIKPVNGPRLFVNGFGSTVGRGELNVLGNRQIAPSLYLGAAAHGSFTEGHHDFDFDGFLDMPRRRTGVGLLRLFRQGGDNWEGQWNVLGVSDRRNGGQHDVHDHGQAILDPYLIDQDNRRLEAWGKTGYFGFAKPWQSLGVIYSGSLHRLNNRYGLRRHTGEQRSAYANVLYHTRIANDDHQLSLGATARADAFDVAFAERDFSRQERTVGATAEYTFRWSRAAAPEPTDAPPAPDLTLVLGLRADHHNLGGAQLSPRLNLRYQLAAATVVRLSAGRGWRSPNLLVDNLNWLPSSRTLTDRDGTTAQPALDPANPGFRGLESAWNFGLSLARDYELAGREGQLVVDAFRTSFQNQLVVDAEQDIATLRIYQLAGRSFANNLTVSTTYELLPRVDVKLAYKYTDARTTYDGRGLREVPLTPRHRALATLGYDGRRFRAHLNYHWTGEQRLIDFDRIPDDIFVDHPQRSPAFGLLNLQLTYVANAKTEFYVGGENLTNVRQRNAVIGAYSPFDGYFDATQVYRPIFGTRAFAGFRWTLP